MTKHTQNFIRTLLLTVSLLSFSALGGCSGKEAETYMESAADMAVSLAWDYAKEAVSGQLNNVPQPQPEKSSGVLKVHFIDVGQGDSILIQDGSHFMLVDAGENDQGRVVVDYLENQGVTSLDYVIGTHPHSDHIGGLDDVLEAFPAKTVIMPPVEHTTATFEDVLDAVAAQGLKITKPVPGNTYELGQSQFTVLGPVNDYKDDLNNWSVGIRLTDGNHSFVMCGDAEAPAEADMVHSGQTLSADVLKSGHHGSRTSSSREFLEAVSPSWAVISCGTDNSYGHPHSETMEQYSQYNIQVFRTDEKGTIIAASSPEGLSWSFTKD